jgi:hypothetical protein
MQETDGTMTRLSADKAREMMRDNPNVRGRILRTGQVFRIQHMYFEVLELSPDGFIAKGISRDAYFRQRNQG